ncbi:hypothetical protein F4805DRAFT_456829 [Annulohypoxylon moriforme]|nr:hypothetical protein F4805DRAFT_456829 [Annulohypoxylon moriforme]
METNDKSVTLFSNEIQMAKRTPSESLNEISINRSRQKGTISTANHVTPESSSNGGDIFGTQHANPGHTDGNAYTKEAYGSSRFPSRQLSTRPCIACTEEQHPLNLARLPCGHEYCPECLNHMIENAIRDEQSFPPRCCGQAVPIEGNERFVDAKTISRFEEKEIEYTGPHRTYCHIPTCAAYIPHTSHSNDIATCGKCQKGTCVKCKGASHDGDCPNDLQSQQVLQLAQDEDWQRCQNCNALIESQFGCNHIVCRCGYHFCYACGARWKTCECPQISRFHWPEDVFGLGQERIALEIQAEQARQDHRERRRARLRAMGLRGI